LCHASLLGLQPLLLFELALCPKLSFVLLALCIFPLLLQSPLLCIKLFLLSSLVILPELVDGLRIDGWCAWCWGWLFGLLIPWSRGQGWSVLIFSEEVRWFLR
jgi:hypothetical protein